MENVSRRRLNGFTAKVNLQSVKIGKIGTKNPEAKAEDFHFRIKRLFAVEQQIPRTQRRPFDLVPFDLDRQTT